MLTRRDAVVLIASLPAGATALANTLSSDSFVADRELTLALSDGLRTQAWLYSGQRYIDTRDAIVVNEDDRIRLRLINDTAAPRSLLLDQASVHLAAGESIVIDMSIDSLQPRVLRDPRRGLVRAITVRPSYQSHATIEPQFSLTPST